jgi:hypothetical protein
MTVENDGVNKDLATSLAKLYALGLSRIAGAYQAGLDVSHVTVNTEPGKIEVTTDLSDGTQQVESLKSKKL